MATRPTLRKGSKGPEVVTLQTCLGAKPIDGDFGSITDTAVRAFQRKYGLGVDGVCGPATWAKVEDVYHLPPYEPPPAPEGGLNAVELDQVAALARASAIQRYNWKGRGIGPPGYIKGMAIAYGCAWRKYNAGHAAFREIAKGNTHNADKDALSYYAGTFNSAGMNNDKAGPDVLRHVYSFLLGLGMRESSGRHCEGVDKSAGASSQTAVTAEAGTFQTSWNARTFSPTILQGLFDEYARGAEGYMSIWQEGVYCSSSSWKNWGTGAGAQFQNMSKRQPMFAVEVAAVVIRNARKHYGPINRREVELRSDANTLFRDVERILGAPALVA